MIIDLQHIQRILFENAKERIAKSYGFKETPKDFKHFSQQLISSLNQRVNPLKRNVSNNEVFEAAVKSIGSNSRDWSTFISKEPQIKELLGNYNPIEISKFDENKLKMELRQYFPGTSCSADCKAVLAWIKKLNDNPEYYNNVIIRVVEGFEKLHGTELPDEKLIICMAGFLSNPSDKWIGFNYVEKCDFVMKVENLKLSGMGFPLASEFFRNLGWNGFKPDRHIKRLLSFWYDTTSIVENNEIDFYTNLIGSKNKELIDNIRFSLIGQKISPVGVKYSEVDNFIWALGSYVMKKGKEYHLTEVNNV